jgi:hypothetical protein
VHSRSFLTSLESDDTVFDKKFTFKFEAAKNGDGLCVDKRVEDCCHQRDREGGEDCGFRWFLAGAGLSRRSVGARRLVAATRAADWRALITMAGKIICYNSVIVRIFAFDAICTFSVR